MYSNELNEKLGNLQDLLENQGNLHNEIRTKKMFVQEDLKNLSTMRIKAHKNTQQINDLVKELGMTPLTEIEDEEEKEEPILIKELHAKPIQQ